MNVPGRPPGVALDRRDFELECIREFSHSGMQLGANVSREERRERIRVAILRENKQHERWRDTPLTYAAAYERVYHKPLDARRPDEAPIEPMRFNWAQPAIDEADTEEDEDSLGAVE